MTREMTSGRGRATITSAARQSSARSRRSRRTACARRPSVGTWRRSTAAASASRAGVEQERDRRAAVEQRQLQRELAGDLGAEAADLDERDLARELERVLSAARSCSAGLGERALADRTDDEDAIAFDAGIGERDGGELVDGEEAVGVGLRPRRGRIEIADDRDHRRGVLDLIANDGERERGVRIEHDRGVGRRELELAAELALGALAEERAPHAIGDAGAAATDGADVDRANAHPAASIAASTGTTADGRRAGAGDEEDAARQPRRTTSSVDEVGGPTAGEHGDHGICTQLGHLSPCLGGSRSEVRRQDQARRGEQTRVDRGSPVKTSSAAAKMRPAAERLGERAIVDAAAARRVDEDRRRLHAREARGVDEVAGLGRQRTVERDDVGLANRSSTARRRAANGVATSWRPE